MLNININNNIKIKNLANKLVPKLTIVCNVEFQTKRKFYSTMDKSINVLKTVTCKYKELERIFKILDNKDLFHDFITNYVIRFINYNSNVRKTRCDTATWWIRLQNCDMNRVIDDENRKLIREYQKNLDIQALKRRLINSIATFSLYVNNENDNSVTSDITDFMAFINESDVEKSINYKKKKSAMLKNRLENLDSIDIRKNFLIVDSETAEILN